MRARFGRLAPLAACLTTDPQLTRAWTVGGESESRVGEYLERELEGAAIVLHDRRIPRSRANIDHVVVAPSGVWVVDSKWRTGRVKWKDIGFLWRTELRLMVGRRDCTKLVASMQRQVAVVAKALGGETAELPIRGALCFNGADWGLFARAFGIDGVLVTFPDDLVARIRKEGVLDDDVVGWTAARLAQALPPALRS